MNQEFLALRKRAGLACAVQMLKCRMIGHISVADLYSHINANVLLGVDLAAIDLAILRRIGEVQLRRCTDHICRNGLDIVVHPLFTDFIVSERGHIRAIIAFGILERQLRLKDVDHARSVSRFLSYTSLIFRCNRDFDGVGRIVGQVVQASGRNLSIICLLERHSNIHKRCLPFSKTVIRLIEGKLNTTNLNDRARFELLSGHAAQQVYVLVLSRHRHVLNRDIDRRLLKGDDRCRSRAILIDARVVIRGNTVAAQEAGFGIDCECNDELLATVSNAAVRARLCAAPVFGEVEAGHTDLIVADGCLRAAIAVAGAAPCVGIPGHSGAVIRIKPNATC